MTLKIHTARSAGVNFSKQISHCTRTTICVDSYCFEYIKHIVVNGTIYLPHSSCVQVHLQYSTKYDVSFEIILNRVYTLIFLFVSRCVWFLNRLFFYEIERNKNDCLSSIIIVRKKKKPTKSLSF